MQQSGLISKGTFQKILEWLIYLLILFGFLGSTLALPNYSYLFVYRVVYGLLLLSVFAYLILYKIEYYRLLNLTVYFLFFWNAYSLISFLWVKDIVSALRDQIFLTVNTLIIIIFIYFYNVIKFDKLLNIITIGYSINIFCGIIEVLFDKHLWTSKVLIYNLHNIPSGFFSNPNDFATFLTLYLPFLLICGLLCKSILNKIYIYSLVFLAIVLIIITTSRANYFALIFEVLIFILIINNKDKIKISKVALITFIVFLCLLSFKVDFGLFNKAVDIISIQIQSLFNFDSASLTSNFRRELLIQYGLSFLVDYLFLGTGSGNSRVLMEEYKKYTINVELHNWFLDVLVSYGVIVFILYIIWYIGILSKLFIKTRFHKDKLIKYMSIACICSLTSFLFSSISSSKMIEMRTMWFVFAISSVILTKVRRDNIEE